MVAPRDKKRPKIQVVVSATHLPTLDLYRKRFGGRVYFRNDHRPRFGKKPLFAWLVGKSSDILDFLEVIYPFAIEKRPQIELALSYLRHRLTLSERASDKATKPGIDALAWRTYAELKSLKKLSSAPIP